MSRRALLVVAGEASGDLLGSRLLEELVRLRPDLEPFGLGGARLRAAGLEPVADSSPLAVVGLVEALGAVPRALALLRCVLREVEKRNARAAVLIDAPGFNLRLARALARRGVRIVYYVSPQIWAWREQRVELLRGAVAQMLVLFPFEADFYERHGIPVAYVGHPLLEEVPALAQAWDDVPADGFPEPLRLALLPGSRPAEIRRHLGPMLGAVAMLAKSYPVEVNLVQAPGVEREALAAVLSRVSVPVTLVADDRHRAIARAHLALCASGTATLEVGLLRTPLLVVYRMAPLTYWLARRVVRVEHVSLVNLILGKPVVPELLQERASAEQLATAARTLLERRESLDEMRVQLGRLRERLGPVGASARAAVAVLKVISD